MKRKSDPRHLHRIKLMQELFSWDFHHDKNYSVHAKKILAKLKKIDGIIEKSAPDRPIAQINKIDLAILRLSIFEMIIDKQSLKPGGFRSTPPKVVIDEAVELGKEFGSDSSSAFINGALGQVVKLEKIEL